VTWEFSDGCPHLHGNFGAADVEGVREFTRGTEETWGEALEKETAWLL
jgi:hypothetical protein